MLSHQKPPAADRQRRSVVLVVQGELGNQLFEWAFGEQLRSRGVRVIADTSRCNGDPPLEIQPLLDAWPHLPRAIGVAAAAGYRSELGSRWRGYVVEPGFGYDQSLLERARAGRLVVGYFQSPQYFSDHADGIRDKLLDFTSNALTPDGQTVRRYLSEHPGFAAVHVHSGTGLPPALPGSQSNQMVDYIDRAWYRMRRSGFEWRLWFGDDIDWVSKNLAEAGDLFVHESLLRARAGELALMASCRGRILTDSPVSWWGGWLGRQPREGGVVVTLPRGPADDLVCDGWLAA